MRQQTKNLAAVFIGLLSWLLPSLAHSTLPDPGDGKFTTALKIEMAKEIQMASTDARGMPDSSLSFATLPDANLLRAQAEKLTRLAAAQPPTATPISNAALGTYLPATPSNVPTTTPIATPISSTGAPPVDLPDAFVVIDDKDLKTDQFNDQAPLLSAVPMPEPEAAKKRVIDATKASDRYDPTVTLQPNNRVVYELMSGDKDVGVLQAYSSPLGTYIPIKELLRRLGIHFVTGDVEQSVQITFADKTTLAFNFRHGQFVKNGSAESLRANDYLVGGFDFYLNYEFLNDVLPIGLSINQASEKITVIERNNGPSLIARIRSMQAALSPERLFSTPDQNYSTPAPSNDSVTVSQDGANMSVVVDDVSQPKSPPPAQVAAATPPPPMEAKPVMGPPTPPGPPSAVQYIPPEAIGSRNTEVATSEDGTLIFQPQIKNNPPNNNLLIEAVEKNNTLYVPLADMVQLLEFDIKVNAAKGTATGTSLDPNHTFALDVKSRTVRIGGSVMKLAQHDVLVKNNALFVSTDAFAAWFGITSVVDRQMMALQLKTDAILPGESRDARHAMWKKLLANSNAEGANYVPRENPYQLASMPFLDVNLSTMAQLGVQNSSSSPISATYTLLGAGDLGYLTTEAYVAGASDSEKPSNIRLRAGRQDATASLLGPLHATAFSMGDVDSPALSLVANNSLGRGVMVTNRKLGAQDNFDTHTFNGDAVPGWEAEIYRNNVLLSFQTVDANGRYEFKDVPILFGSSNFRVVLYGPQGQIEERTENIMVGDRMLGPGQVEYSFSANEKNTSVINLNQNSGAALLNNPQGMRVVGETRYGITDNLTAGIGVASTQLQDGQHDYASASLATSFYNIFTEADAVKDLHDGWAGGITALTSIEDVSLRMRHRVFSNFLSEAEDQYLDPRKSETDIDANTQLYLPLIQDLGVGLEAKRETFTIQQPRTTITNRLSKSIWGFSISNTLDYVRSLDTQLQGTFGVQTRIGNTLVRASGDYGVQPIMGLNGINLTTEYRFSTNVSGRTEFDKGLGTNSQNTLSQSVNWDFDSYRLSLSTSVDDKAHVTAGLSLVFSVGHDDVFNRWHVQRNNMGNGGAIAGRVFVDDNYNGKLDANEKVLPDTAVRVNRFSHKVEDGNMFIAPVQPYDVVNVDIDPLSVKDPLLASSVEGYKVTTRPGDVVQLDFPLVATSAIDGNIKMVDDAGNHYQIPDIVVELQDGKGKRLRRVISEYDGFYTFDKIRAGDYIITIPAEALAEYNAVLVKPVHLSIKKVSDFYSGKDVTIHIKGAVPAKLVSHQEKND